MQKHYNIEFFDISTEIRSETPIENNSKDKESITHEEFLMNTILNIIFFSNTWMKYKSETTKGLK